MRQEKEEEEEEESEVLVGIYIYIYGVYVKGYGTWLPQMKVTGKWVF